MPITTPSYLTLPYCDRANKRYNRVAMTDSMRAHRVILYANGASAANGASSANGASAADGTSAANNGASAANGTPAGATSVPGFITRLKYMHFVYWGLRSITSRPATRRGKPSPFEKAFITIDTTNMSVAEAFRIGVAEFPTIPFV